ncbi:hypothetical protein P8C59_008591 [Phyllachora maydis]|uniref:Uncharacterized protein n=1 Tax=Phyllachora maydis TaxID=1825666 RepID=A0AAD9IBE5_9PEZI|nr:hypothetical protein P8C59_008591 [Phyllachora maydis]
MAAPDGASAADLFGPPRKQAGSVDRGPYTSTPDFSKPRLDRDFYRFLVQLYQDPSVHMSEKFAGVLLAFAWSGNNLEGDRVELTRQFFEQPEIMQLGIPAPVLNKLKEYNVSPFYFYPDGSLVEPDDSLKRRFHANWARWCRLVEEDKAAGHSFRRAGHADRAFTRFFPAAGQAPGESVLARTKAQAEEAGAREEEAEDQTSPRVSAMAARLGEQTELEAFLKTREKEALAVWDAGQRIYWVESKRLPDMTSNLLEAYPLEEKSYVPPSPMPTERSDDDSGEEKEGKPGQATDEEDEDGKGIDPTRYSFEELGKILRRQAKRLDTPVPSVQDAATGIEDGHGVDLTCTGDDTDGHVPDRTGPDWMRDSVYRDTLQPPLALRLTHVLNFLRDEDVDRCMDFHGKFEETGRYLHWLWHMDPDRQIHKASQHTRAMFFDAIRKALVHRQFEAHHYTATPLEVARFIDVPKASGRLNWVGAVADFPPPCPGGRVRKRTERPMLPMPIPPRRVHRVNGCLDGSAENERHHQVLKRDESQFWTEAALDPDALPEGRTVTNHFEMEHQYFCNLIDTQTVGWIRQDSSGTKLHVLPDDSLVHPSSSAAWAEQRGALRAGLQQVLRTFRAVEHFHLLKPYRRLVLPVSEPALRRYGKLHTERQWTPPRLGYDRMPAQLEPMPYGAFWRKLQSKRAELRTKALNETSTQHAGKDGFVQLPRSLVVGGPLVRPGLDRRLQAQQELLTTCHTLAKQLLLAGQKFPRQLMQDVNALVHNGKNGLYPKEMPGGVRLRVDEFRVRGGLRGLRFLDDPDEQQWLRFLAGDCYNSSNGLAQLGFDGPQFTLFRIFATRLFKILDDRGPSPLFPSPHTEITVDLLLSVMNRGGHESSVTKVQFQPHDAWRFLERLGNAGFIKWREDLAVTGTVKRAPFSVLPEQAVRWPEATTGRVKPTCCPKTGGDLNLKQAFNPPRLRAAQTDDDDVTNFFRALAVRLGYTIYTLEQDMKDHWQAPVETHRRRGNLHDSVRLFDETCEEPAFKPPVAEMRDMVQWSNPADFNEKLTEQGSLNLMRQRTVEELHHNLTMLAPARQSHWLNPKPPRQKETHEDKSGSKKTRAILKWDHNWDWASPGVRGQRRQFWSLSRWPLELDRLEPAQEAKVKSGADIDPLHLWEPANEDATDTYYMRPKLRRYQAETTRFRPGPATLPIGDTPLQMQKVQEVMTNAVARAMGIHESRWNRLSSFIFGTPRSTTSRNMPLLFGRPRGEEWLPEVDARDGAAVAASWDPVEEGRRLAVRDSLLHQAARRRRDALDALLPGERSAEKRQKQGRSGSRPRAPPAPDNDVEMGGQ